MLWLLPLTLAAVSPLADLIDVERPPVVKPSLCTPEDASYLNRDYRLIAVPAELVDRPRIIFDGGTGDRLKVVFKADSVVVGAFHYNDKGTWDWPDRQKADTHGWSLYRADGFRGDSNGLRNGRPNFAETYYRQYQAGQTLSDLPPWWVCLAIVPAADFPALLAADKAAPLAEAPPLTTPLPVLVAHRGLVSVAPENTLPAFRAALAVGLGIELDVNLTRDGEVVIMHDATVDRTTNGQGKVNDLTLAEIRQLDAGIRFHPDFVGTQVPTFREVLELARTESLKPTPIAVNLKRQGVEFVDQLTALIAEAGLVERCFLFDCPIGRAAEYKKVARGVDVTVPAKDEAAFRQALANPAADSMWVYFIPTPELMDEARAAGKEVHVTPFMDAQGAKAWRAIRAAGVTTFCTDRVPEVRRLWAPRR